MRARHRECAQPCPTSENVQVRLAFCEQNSPPSALANPSLCLPPVDPGACGPLSVVPPIVWSHVCFCLCSDSLPHVHICSIDASAEVPGKARGPRLDLLPTHHEAGVEHIPGGSLAFAGAMMGGKLSDSCAVSK